MTNDQIIARGRDAARHLADESLMSFFAEMENDIKTASFNKPSTDSSEREAVYFQLKGIADVLNMMLAYKTAGEDVLRRLNNPEETHDD